LIPVLLWNFFFAESIAVMLQSGVYFQKYTKKDLEKEAFILFFLICSRYITIIRKRDIHEMA